MAELLGQLSSEKYWKWRFHAEDMQHFETKSKLAVNQLEVLNRDGEIQRLKTALFKSSISGIQSHVELAKERYKAVAKELEDSLGFPLTDCVIDEITLEVKKIDKE